MTKPTVAVLEYLRKLNLDLDEDVLREMIRVLTQMVMELEVEEQIGAGRYERTPERKSQRNGYRERVAYAGGRDTAEDPEGERGDILSIVA